MSGPEHSPTKNALRWVAFLPASALGAWLAWLVVMLGNRLTFGMQGVNPDAFLSRTFIEFISHAAMGAAFVYVGAKVAPNHHKIVAYVLAALGLVAAGFMLFPAFMVSNYWAVWAAFSLVAGLGLTAYSVSTGEVELEPQQ
jgi:hypothetical protein